MAKLPVMQGQSQRQREEREVPIAQRSAVIKAVTNVTNSNVTLWTVTLDPAKYLYVRDIGVCNISGVTIAVTVYVVPDGGSAANTNKVYDAFSVVANDSVTLSAIVDKTYLPGDQIIAVTDNVTGANFWLDGVEFTGGLATV